MSFYQSFFEELVKIAGDDAYIKRKRIPGPSGDMPSYDLQQRRAFSRMSRPVPPARQVGSLSPLTRPSTRRPAPKLVPR